jgi:hypothetical protein
VDVGGHLVARQRDQQDRHVAQPARELRQQRQGGLVGPVHVVENDRDRAVRSRLCECAPQRLDERGLAGVLGGTPELRQQARQIGRQGATGLEQAGRAPEAFAQDLRDGRVRLGDGCASGAGVHREPGLRERVGDEPRLADARLAGHEHAAAESVANRGTRGLERAPFPFPADQRPVVEHAPSVERKER